MSPSEAEQSREEVLVHDVWPVADLGAAVGPERSAELRGQTTGKCQLWASTLGPYSLGSVEARVARSRCPITSIKIAAAEHHRRGIRSGSGTLTVRPQAVQSKRRTPTITSLPGSSPRTWRL